MRARAIALLLVSAALPGTAQQFGAENLAPYIPTPQVLVESMLEAASVKPGDVVYDLGSGDGRIVITAAQKFGAKGVGVEMVPDLCRKAQRRIKELGLEDRVSIVQASALRVDLSPATVVTMYLMTSSNERLRPNLEKYLKPGARVVSNDYPIKGWKESRLKIVKTGSTEHKIYVYEIGRTK
jgi:ubiquinone/menaquinone biosynthesis C-methylase UbiE